ncbi:MAG: hypothetical protein GY947_02885 [Rhodobacteraceae bacterium]|nr:hypothetical protein [Paracoccaceae bacterium]
MSLTAAALAVFLCLIWPAPAHASMACGSHKKLTKALTGKYKEARKGLGLVGNRRVMEVFVSESGSWTLVMTDLNGVSCIIAAGHSWQDAPPPKQPEH